MVAERLKGWIGEGTNRGDFLGTDSLDLILKKAFYNDGRIGNSNRLTLILHDQLFNKGDMVCQKFLNLQGEGTLTNHQTIQGGTQGMSLSMKALENHSLIQAEGSLLLSPGHRFLNHQGAWIHALGKVKISGRGIIRNEGGTVEAEEPVTSHNPRLEGSGILCEQDLIFENFDGSLENKGAWTTGGKAQGTVPHFVNQGLWKATLSALKIKQFDNNPGENVLVLQL